ncbi:MAG TPA: APC family permease [Actinomycetes bacterium]|nr:APC family permease [Actinomycetes bacterium]
MAAEATDLTLEREAIGLREILFQAITHMAPAAGVAFAIPVGAAFAGGSLAFAVLLAVIGCSLTALSLGQLSRHLPTAGSFYTYTSKALHPSIGFLAGWVYAFGEATVFPLCIALLGPVIAGTLNTEFGWSASLWWPWVALGCLTVFALGYFGIRISARTGTLLGAFEIAVFLVLGLTLVGKAGSGNTIAIFSAKHANIPGFIGFSGVFAGLVYSIFAFIGFEAAAPLAEEAENPRRTIGQAALASAALIGLFYVVVTYGATAFFGADRMGDFLKLGNGNPYEAMARSVWGFGWVAVFLAVINSSVACSNAGNNATTRTWFAMGRIGLLPRALGRVHSRHRSPHVAVIVSFLLSTAVVMWLGFQYDPLTAFAILGTVIVITAVITYILINVSCFAYYWRFRRDEFNLALHGLVPLIGVALFVPALLTGAGITVFKFISPLPAPFSYAGIATGVWTLVGLVYMLYLYRADPHRLEDTKKVFLEEETPEIAVVSSYDLPVEEGPAAAAEGHEEGVP